MSTVANPAAARRYARFAWGALGYVILVILWGAFVRATGSGAGCGDHWPVCNGQVIPRDPSVETIIEFTHRLTSGLALIAAIVLPVWARRVYPVGHPVRLYARLSLLLMITEALVGAGLVLFQLVAENASIGRAIAMGRIWSTPFCCWRPWRVRPGMRRRRSPRPTRCCLGAPGFSGVSAARDWFWSA